MCIFRFCLLISTYLVNYYLLLGSPPSKPPRLNLHSLEDIDRNLPVDGKPVFVPPSPPPTPPSATVPRQDIQKLIAEGRLTVEEGSDQ